MRRAPVAAVTPPNRRRPPTDERLWGDRLWLPLTLLTAAFVAFAVAVFLRAGLPLPLHDVLGPRKTPSPASTPDTSTPVDLETLAPDLSDWPTDPGCAFPGWLGVFVVGPSRRARFAPFAAS